MSKVCLFALARRFFVCFCFFSVSFNPHLKLLLRIKIYSTHITRETFDVLGWYSLFNVIILEKYYYLHLFLQWFIWYYLKLNITIKVSYCSALNNKHTLIHGNLQWPTEMKWPSLVACFSVNHKQSRKQVPYLMKECS